MKYMMYNLVNNRKARGIKKVGLVRHQQVCLTFHFHVVYRYILHFFIIRNSIASQSMSLGGTQMASAFT
jgi:hypothetical protein